MIQIGGVQLPSAKRRAYFCKSIAIKMGGVSRYLSKVSGSGVNLMLLNVVLSFRRRKRVFWKRGVKRVYLLEILRIIEILESPQSLVAQNRAMQP